MAEEKGVIFLHYIGDYEGPINGRQKTEYPAFEKPSLSQSRLRPCHAHAVPRHNSGADASFSYHDALSTLSYTFVHLIEEAFDIPLGTFDAFFKSSSPDTSVSPSTSFLEPQHRIKLLRYPPSFSNSSSQGVGAHKDSSGWLTFLYQVGKEEGLEVVNSDGEWISAPPIENSFVVNFGNAFEAATEGAVRATIHRVKVGRHYHSR